MESKPPIKNKNFLKKPKQEKKLTFEEELFMKIKPIFYFKDHLRFIKDYEHLYKTYVKQRWENRTVYDVFCKEFLAYSSDYYKESILAGRITVNKKKIDLDYKLKANDLIEHSAIRKEPPVYNIPIEIIYEDDILLVINKPPSIPVHVCGPYCFNTIMGILRSEYNYKNLYTLHRLDKLTSGLLLISKKPELSQDFHIEIKNKNVEKIYLARVHGEFKEGIEIKKPIYCVSHKKGEYDVCEESDKERLQGKDCETSFKPIWYDSFSDTSLVECKPITGKTHQIRVHLKSIGHSIVNDINYGGKFKGNLLVNFLEEKNNGKEEKEENGDIIKKKIKIDEIKEIAINKEEEKKETNENEEYINLKGEKTNYSLDTFNMEICLHSYKYQFQGKQFETKMPYWALKKNLFS